ncbi:(2Fe-2S)-binding protein, partial [bacterium]|nr:(2Fe-2S)-binding protein [bacterium]
MINIKVDNIKIRVEEGITILDAAKEAGIKIPTLCVMPELEFAPGSCRICVVEVVGIPALVASCAYPVREGLKIYTNNKRVIKARKMTLEFLLASHPLDCMTCEKNGSCVLEDLAYDFGIKKSRFEQNKKEITLDNNNPFIVRELDKCVLCGRCVETCNEIQQSNILDFGYRGTKTEIIVDGGVDLKDSNCVFCGQCVAVCPVGALTDKEAKGKGRTWEFKKVKTTCSYCGCGCNFDFNIKDGKVVKVTSNPESVVNGINLCVKGRFG